MLIYIYNIGLLADLSTIDSVITSSGALMAVTMVWFGMRNRLLFLK